MDICFEKTINNKLDFFCYTKLCVCKLSRTCHTAEKLLDVTSCLKKLCVLQCSIEAFQAAELF